MMTNILATASTNGGSAVLGFVLIAAGIAAYWVPSIVAAVRHVRNTGSIVVINLLTGWTVIGWIVALAMACRSVDRSPAAMPPPPAPPADHVATDA
jgi:hypothetical protein